MASIGQADHHINSISGLGAIHPAAFSNGWGSDYRDRYSTEMQGSYHHGRSLLNRSGPTRSRYPHQQQVPIESSSSAGHQRQPSSSSILPQHHHSVHTADSIDIRRGGGSLSRVPVMLGSPDSMSRGSPGSFQGSSSELYDSSGAAVGSGGDWQQFMDSGVRYSSLRPPNSPSGSPLQQQQQHGSASCKAGGGRDGGVDEGAMIRELIGRLGGGSSNGGPSSPPLPPPQRAAVGMENLAALKVGGGNHDGWNSAVASAVELTSNVGGLTVDPSKGGLSLSAVGTGLPTPHCLPPFSADPGFAERAAKFSSFMGNYAQPFSPAASESAGSARMRPWSGGSPLSESQSFSKHVSGVTSSCLPMPLESAGVLNGGTSAPPQEGLPESMIIDNHSGREISDNLVGSAAAAACVAAAAAAAGDHEEDEDDDENDDTVTAEGKYGLVKEKAPMKLLSRTSSNLLATTNHDDEEGGGRTTTTSADASSNPRRIRGLSASNLDREQTASAVHRDACLSPGGSTVTGATDVSAKKRRSNIDERHPSKDIGSVSVSSHAKTTEADREETKAKRLRRGGHEEYSKEKEETTRSKAAAAERSSSETSGETSPRSIVMKEQSKPSEPPKPDYIHVRARRGQATDSHSLAERVRREKISERMKFLQDLVPGCSKVTGKAVMLDEIINYVQSLQRQVEFLSMKLASVSPRLDFNLDGFLGKEGPHPGCQAVGLGSETSTPYPPLQHSQPHHGLDYQMHSQTSSIRSSMNPPPIPAVTPPRIDAFGDGIGQLMWDGDLQSIVQMGLGPAHTPSAANPSSHCHVPPGQVKVELQQSPISCL